MSSNFENDIYEENEEIASLEDTQEIENTDSSNFVFPSELYKIKLVYSFEGLYATNPNKANLNVGDKVIVPTRYGLDLAENLGLVKVPIGIKPSDVVQIERKATEDDINKATTLTETEKEASKTFQQKVEFHHLDMKLVSVHFLVGEQKALFFFSSENRVDFRELVKDLVSIFKMRIELRQIGVRDECRITGGLGVCGRPYCCNCVSDKLKPVSIKMAKEQNLSLNSMKISGQCGRLLCCLSYEFDWYSEARKKLPTEDIRLYYDNTNFRVTEVNPLTYMVKMIGDDGRLLEVNAKRFVRDGNKWRIK